MVPRVGSQLNVQDKEKYEELHKKFNLSLPINVARGRNVSFDKSREAISSVNQDISEASYPGFTPASQNVGLTPLSQQPINIETPKSLSLQSRLSALQEKKQRRNLKAVTAGSNRVDVDELKQRMARRLSLWF